MRRVNHSYFPFQMLAAMQHGYCVRFYAEVQHATASEGLAQGPYMAARVNVRKATNLPMSLHAPQCDCVSALELRRLRLQLLALSTILVKT